jgi:hypothetical protein
MLLEGVVGELQALLGAVRPQITVHGAMDRLAELVEPGAPCVVPQTAPVRLLLVADDLRNLGPLGLGGLEGAKHG